MERTATNQPSEASRAEHFADVADHIRSIDRVNKLVWAAGSLAEFDAAVEASTTINDADAGMPHAYAVQSGYVRVERVGFQGGRRALVYMATGSGHEFARRYPAAPTLAVAA